MHPFNITEWMGCGQQCEWDECHVITLVKLTSATLSLGNIRYSGVIKPRKGQTTHRRQCTSISFPWWHKRKQLTLKVRKRSCRGVSSTNVYSSLHCSPLHTVHAISQIRSHIHTSNNTVEYIPFSV